MADDRKASNRTRALAILAQVSQSSGRSLSESEGATLADAIESDLNIAAEPAPPPDATNVIKNEQ
jgi:hypothetical protein